MQYLRRSWQNKLCRSLTVREGQTFECTYEHKYTQIRRTEIKSLFICGKFSFSPSLTVRLLH